jgi:hypothetical protein
MKNLDYNIEGKGVSLVRIIQLVFNINCKIK